MADTFDLYGPMGPFARSPWDDEDEDAYATPEECSTALMLAGARQCRDCGCSEFSPCVQGGEPCHWIQADLCSACAPRVVLVSDAEASAFLRERRASG